MVDSNIVQRTGDGLGQSIPIQASINHDQSFQFEANQAQLQRQNMEPIDPALTVSQFYENFASDVDSTEINNPMPMTAEPRFATTIPIEISYDQSLQPTSIEVQPLEQIDPTSAILNLNDDQMQFYDFASDVEPMPWTTDQYVQSIPIEIHCDQSLQLIANEEPSQQQNMDRNIQMLATSEIVNYYESTATPEVVENPSSEYLLYGDAANLINEWELSFEQL